MKNLVLGVILGLFLFPLAHEVSRATIKGVPLIVEYGVTKPFNKKCIKNEAKNGHGWEFVMREYYDCGKIAIFISDMLYGEYIKKTLDKE